MLTYNTPTFNTLTPTKLSHSHTLQQYIYIVYRNNKENTLGSRSIISVIFRVFIFFFKQKTAYEMRISDWSSDVCSSDLPPAMRNSAPTFAFSSVSRYFSTMSRTSIVRACVAPAGRRNWIETRSEERRVGKECVSTGRSRW